MNDFDEHSELQEFSSLPREMEPPPELEERVVQALQARGLVGSQSRRRMASWWQLAAATLIAATLGWTGRGFVEPGPLPVAAEREFLLLLSEPEVLETTKSEADLVEEYRNWATSLGREGRLVAAGKLELGGQLLSNAIETNASESPGRGLDTISGYFQVRAASWNEALDLARSCPHLAYGGEISVRMLEQI